MARACARWTPATAGPSSTRRSCGGSRMRRGRPHWPPTSPGASAAASVRSAGGWKSTHYQSCRPEALRAFAIRECAEADQALDDYATLWRHGGSPLLRALTDAGTVELLGGPVAQPFHPRLNLR